MRLYYRSVLLLAGIFTASIGTMTISTAEQTSSSVPSPAGAVPRYTITDLGTLPGAKDGATPVSINDKGQVVGTSNYLDGKTRAFLWSDGKMTDLGTLDGASSAASAINKDGKIVGQAAIASGHRHGFLWQKGVMRELPSAKSDENTSAVALNTSGLIVGESYGKSVQWRDGQRTNLPFTLSGSEGAVNDAGEVVGYLSMNSQHPNFRACLWKSDKVIDLGTLGGVDSFATAINNRGQIVGRAGRKSVALSEEPPRGFDTHPNARRNVVTRAFLWENGTMQDIGTLGGPNSAAKAINDNGEIVGTADALQKRVFIGNQSAFVRLHNKMYDLNTAISSNSAWVLSAPTAINNRGQIVGYGYRKSDAGNGKMPQERALLLTPVISR